MQIETWPIDRPQPYENNPRLNDDAVESVARSIQEFGFRQPIVVDEDGVVIIGHTRLKAAKKLGLTEVPVHVARELSAEKIKALRIADNKTAEIAEWNLELLPIELSELQGMEFDLDLLGFDQDELAKLLDPGVQEGLTDADEVPEPPDEAVTQPGDLWILGEHRLLCGDSSSVEDVDRLLDGQPIHLVNTDPPYNVKVEPRSNNAIAAGLSSFEGTKHHQSMDVARHPEKSKPTGRKLRAKDRPLANDFVTDEEFDRLLDAWFGNCARVLLPGRGFYIWGGYANCANYPPFLKKHALYFSQAIIWDKQHPVLTRKDFMGAHEWCFYGWREGAAHEFFGPDERHRPLAHQEGQSAEHGPPDREASGVGRAGDAVLIAHRRERPRPLRRQRFDPDRRPANRPTGIPDGTRPTILRCDCAAMAEVHAAVPCTLPLVRIPIVR